MKYFNQKNAPQIVIHQQLLLKLLKLLLHKGNKRTNKLQYYKRVIIMRFYGPLNKRKSANIP